MRDYSPADSADYADEYSLAVLFRRERQVGDGCEIIAVIVVLLFVFYLRKSARSAGDFGVSIEYSCVFIFPQIAQITQRTQRNAASCIISQRNSSGLLELLGFVYVNQGETLRINW